MYRKGFTLVEITIILVIIVLLAVIAAPYLNVIGRANETAARATLSMLSTGAENYASSYSGVYPVSVAELTEFTVSAGTYCASAAGMTTSVGGYNYACTLTAGGYTFVAKPVTKGSTGSTAYTVTTGRVFTPL